MLGARLKHLRESRNLTQEDIAKLIGVTREAYSHYETERRKMPPQAIVKLAKFYDVTTDNMFGLTDNPSSPEREFLEMNRDTLLQLRDKLKPEKSELEKLTEEEHNYLLRLVNIALNHLERKGN